jgi:hypothetical protein
MYIGFRRRRMSGASRIKHQLINYCLNRIWRRRMFLDDRSDPTFSRGMVCGRIQDHFQLERLGRLSQRPQMTGNKNAPALVNNHPMMIKGGEKFRLRARTKSLEAARVIVLPI